MGKSPHLSRLLRGGKLVAPLGPAGVVQPGAFYVEVAPSAQRDAVEPFVAWLHDEAARNARSARRAPTGRRQVGLRA